MAQSIITQVTKNDEIQSLEKFTPEEHTKPTVIIKKPRARRFVRSLFCCFGAKASEPSVPLNAEPQAGHYSPKLSEKLLLPPVRPCDYNKKCLIIDLDETLVHSSFKPVKNPDFVIPVEIDSVIHQVYVLKRPYVDEFLQRISGLYECILFTASLAKYADPVADLLDRWGVFRARLFREACVFHKGNYVKDLNRLGRDLKKVVIIDNSPASYAFHPDNAIPVQSWFDDMNDTELIDLIPFLERLAKVDNIYSLLSNSNEPGSTMEANQEMVALNNIANKETVTVTTTSTTTNSTSNNSLVTATERLQVTIR